MKGKYLGDLEIKLIHKFLLEFPSIVKSEKDRVMKSEKYSDELKSLISIYPEKKSKP